MRRRGGRPIVLGGALLLAGLPVGGCGTASPAAEGGLPVERRAALAHLVVDNRTPHSLTISVRYAVEPGGEIVLGEVGAGSTLEMPPIPATEPVILTARARGFERRLEPRSFEIDQRWRWVIEAEDG